MYKLYLLPKPYSFSDETYVYWILSEHFDSSDYEVQRTHLGIIVQIYGQFGIMKMQLLKPEALIEYPERQ